MNHHGIVHFEIAADDPEKLASFYQQLFGWQIEEMDMGGDSYWTIVTGPVDEQGMPSQPGYINGGMSRRMSPDQRTSTFVDVESVDDYLAKAKDLGGTVLVEKTPVPQMGWLAMLQDPQGNPFGMWQTDPSAG